MTIKSFALAFIGLIFWVNLALAEPLTPKQETYSLGFEFSHITYSEPSIDVKENGPGGGIYGIYEFRSGWSVFNVLHADAHLNYYNMKYEGSGEIDDINDFMAEPRIWVGHDFDISPKIKVTPYVGIGYRALFDNLDGKVSTTGAQGYDRLSQYLYAPVGFQFSTEAIEGWRLGFSAEYDFFIRGWQRSYLSTFQGFPDVTNTQKKGYGVRGSIDIVKKTDRLNYVVSPYIRYWDIKKSDTVTATGSLFQVSGYEPANKSTEIGMRLGVEF